MSVQVTLPSQLDFSRKPPSLPAGTDSKLLCIQPTNGTSFQANQVVQWDLPSLAGLYLDGKTAFIRYKVTYTSGATAGVVRGIPALTNFSKLDEFIASQPVNSVYNYHQVANMWYNTNTSVSDKFGQSYALGIGPATGTPTLDQMESYTLPTVSSTNDLYLSVPLVCSSLSSFDKYIPTGLMGPYRIQLTVAPISDVAVVAANITALTITDPQLCIQSINMGAETDMMVASMGTPKVTLKTFGWANAGVGRIAAATSGFQTIVANHRYRSIENIFCLFSGDTATIDLNGFLDSRDITSGNGSYQIQVGQTTYPSLPISTINHKGSVLQYLRECTGSLTDFRNSMSINRIEFSYGSSSGNTTAVEPAKFILGIPLSKVQPQPYQSNALLSGVDAQSTPINLLVNIGTATQATNNTNVFMVAQYSQLIEIDPMMRQINVVM
jgi:hypothetical protein